MCEGGIHHQRSRGPIPIIICCKTEHIAAGVIQSLKPEYDVHYILDVENASREILGILCGEAPSSTPNNMQRYCLGNKLYGTGEAFRPRAVLFGGTYDDGAVERICEDLLLLLRQLRTRTRPIAATTTATAQIPLLKASQSAAMPPLGPEYGRKIVQRAKACLQKLEEDGKFDGTHGGVYIY